MHTEYYPIKYAGEGSWKAADSYGYANQPCMRLSQQLAGESVAACGFAVGMSSESIPGRHNLSRNNEKAECSLSGPAGSAWAATGPMGAQCWAGARTLTVVEAGALHWSWHPASILQLRNVHLQLAVVLSELEIGVVVTLEH